MAEKPIPLFRLAPCPYDTNGDGDCGRALCPYCGGGNIPSIKVRLPKPKVPQAEVTQGVNIISIDVECEWCGAKSGEPCTDDRGRLPYGQGHLVRTKRIEVK